MYELRSENLTHLGGPMGSEYTTTNWRKFFKSLDGAKECAEKDYADHKGSVPLKWTKNDKGKLSTGDLGYVMYHIKEIKTED